MKMLKHLQHARKVAYRSGFRDTSDSLALLLQETRRLKSRSEEPYVRYLLETKLNCVVNTCNCESAMLQEHLSAPVVLTHANQRIVACINDENAIEIRRISCTQLSEFKPKEFVITLLGFFGFAFMYSPSSNPYLPYFRLLRTCCMVITSLSLAIQLSHLLSNFLRRYLSTGEKTIDEMKETVSLASVAINSDLQVVRTWLEDSFLRLADSNKLK